MCRALYCTQACLALVRWQDGDTKLPRRTGRKVVADEPC